MASISNDSTNPDSAILAGVRLFQQRLESAPIYGDKSDELLRSLLELLFTYMSESRPTLTHALGRAQKAPLPSEVLDELMAVGARIDADRMSTASGVVDLDATRGDGEQILRRLIAGVEHMIDAARELTRRTERLLQEFESGRSDRS